MTVSPVKAVWFWRCLTLSFAVVLLVMSLLPGDELVRFGLHRFSDKMLHACGYLGLAFLWGQGWPRWPLYAVWALVFLFGAGVELAQSLSPWRVFEWADMVANGLGALLACLVLWTWRTLRRRSRSI